MRRPRFTSAAVAIPITDWPRALLWYRDVLGCTLRRADTSVGQIAELSFGLQRFTLWLDWVDPHLPLPEGPTRTQTLLLGVRSVTASRKDLKSRGARLFKTPTGFWSLKDPDGNLIILFEDAPSR